MKKICFFTVLILCVLLVKSQEISFSFSAEFKCLYAELDSIYVENLSQGGDTTLYWNDTVLSLIFTGLLNNPTSDFPGIVIEAFPNPFNAFADVNVYIPEDGTYNFIISDLKGNEVYRTRYELIGAWHSFKFYSGMPDVNIISVKSEKHGSSFSVINLANKSVNQTALIYTGKKELEFFKEEDTYNLRSAKSFFPYAIGDELRFTVYKDGYFEEIIDSPMENTDYFFNIASENPSPPIAGNNIGFENSIEWNWHFVEDAIFYTYNTENNYNGSINIGMDTSFVMLLLPGGKCFSLFVWAVNHCGYSEPVLLKSGTLLNYHNYHYKIVQLGGLCWMAENLRTEKFSDGTDIYEVTSFEENFQEPGYCWFLYNYNTFGSVYGALYNWYSIDTSSNDNRSICPDGWRVPSVGDWNNLTGYLSSNTGYWCGNQSVNVAKAIADSLNWINSNVDCDVGNNPENNNLTGFSGIPGGAKDSSYGDFIGVNHIAMWAGTSLHPQFPNSVWVWIIRATSSHIDQTTSQFGGFNSVRCVKDIE